MSLPVESRQGQDPVDDYLIDRLVDGELPDVERRKLLLQFENEPSGWRRCALAFLEAQVWRQAFASVAAAASGTAATAMARRPSSKRSFWRPVARLTGLAACLAAAFALGWAYHGGLEQPTPYARVNQGNESVAAEPVKPPQQIPIEAAKEQTGPPKPPEAFAPLVKQWQQQGFSVETEQRVVSVESKDGRRLNFPVQEVRLRYVGNRIY